MRIRLGVPNDANDDEKRAILDAALESVTRANQADLARGHVPDFRDALRRGIKWKPEPPGDEHFDLAKTVMRRKWGDCDDLAPYWAATLRTTGEDPEAHAYVRRSGPSRWHAVVGRSDGSTDDPSRAAGMGSVGGDEYRGPFWNPMFGERLALAAQPLAPGYGWAGRVDVPSASVPATYSMLARGYGPAHAIVGACHGALEVCGEDAYDEDMLRVMGLSDLLSGYSPSEVVGALSHYVDDAVGFFGALAPAAMSLAAPIASKILPGVFPGGKKGNGAPAAPPPPSGGGSGGFAPGTTLFQPGGPIIVRF